MSAAGMIGGVTRATTMRRRDLGGATTMRRCDLGGAMREMRPAARRYHLRVARYALAWARTYRELGRHDSAAREIEAAREARAMAKAVAKEGI